MKVGTASHALSTIIRLRLVAKARIAFRTHVHIFNVAFPSLCKIDWLNINQSSSSTSGTSGRLQIRTWVTGRDVHHHCLTVSGCVCVCGGAVLWTAVPFLCYSNKVSMYLLKTYCFTMNELFMYHVYRFFCVWNRELTHLQSVLWSQVTGWRTTYQRI